MQSFRQQVKTWRQILKDMRKKSNIFNFFPLFGTSKTQIEFFFNLYHYDCTIYTVVRDTPLPRLILFPCIVAVVLFGEPNQWDSKLQLIVDVLISNGMPTQPPQEVPSTHLPVLACNMDLFWMSEVPLPR